MNELQIHDIKPLVQIPDYSIYIFSLLCLLGVLFVLTIFFILYKLFKNRDKNSRKVILQKLKDIEFKDSKKAAYEITKYARELARSDRERALCSELIHELEKFKYKKEVMEFDKESRVKYELFCEAVDV